MTVTDLAEGHLKTGLLQIVENVVLEIIDDRRIRNTIMDSVMEPVRSTENIGKIRKRLATEFFDSKVVISALVERLHLQAVSEAVQNVQDCMAMEVKDASDIEESRCRRPSDQPSDHSYDSSSSGDQKPARRKKRDRKSKKSKNSVARDTLDDDLASTVSGNS